ncbi:hypothetical protein AVEN_168827-1, partial [Araneus ventricosus]
MGRMLALTVMYAVQLTRCKALSEREKKSSKFAFYSTAPNFLMEATPELRLE